MGQTAKNSEYYTYLCSAKKNISLTKFNYHV